LNFLAFRKIKGFSMTYYQDSQVHIFFGDKKTALDPDCIRGEKSSQFRKKFSFPCIEKELSFLPERYVFLHQVHGVEGMVITEETQEVPAFVSDGDYVLTNVPGISIGVITADCIPLVLRDTTKKALGVVHAGWKGLVAGVVEQAVEHMHKEYGSSWKDISFMVGPSAHGCCYEVGEDFFERAVALRPAIRPFLESAIFKRENKLFFDSLMFLKSILFQKGAVESDLNFEYAECTICKPIYCSYRREKMSPLRQLTIVSLK
jgi:YfiH family protein